MGIVEYVKKFFAARKMELPQITLSDGPFDYEYVSISHVVGAKLPENSPDPLQIASFPKLNATVYLTHDVSKYDVHIHRATAYACLLLTGFLGVQDKRFRKLSKWIDRFQHKVFGFEWCFLRKLSHEEKRINIEESKRHASSGCYLIYKAINKLKDPIDLKFSRRFSHIGMVLDGIDKSQVGMKHDLTVKNASAAVSIAMTDTNGSPDIKFMYDDFHLIGNDGLVVYLRSVHGGNLGVNVITNTSQDLIKNINTYVTALNNDPKLDSVITAYAASNLKTNDNLRTFIASWSALELLVNHLEKANRRKFKLMLNDKNIKLPKANRDLKVIDPKYYSLSERFYASACVLNFVEANNDIADFIAINKKRNDYYHELKVKDTDLPAEDVQKLLRKYLKFAL